MRELATFAGAAGGILGGHLLGWRTVCAVELEQYAIDVLIARQNDGLLPPFPVWDDIRTFDGRPWRGRVDVVSGGFPCQDISAAGKGAGLEGERSGLWSEMARIIRDVRPRFVFVENSPMLTARGLGRVLGDLASLGYDAEWTVLGADDCGAPHRRKRIWVLAHANSVSNPDGGRCEVERVNRVCQDGDTQPGMDSHGRDCQVPDADDERRKAREGIREARPPERRDTERELGARGRVEPWPAEPNVGRVAHGVAARVDRLRATGNGQVPRVAAAAFELLRARGGW